MKKQANELLKMAEKMNNETEASYRAAYKKFVSDMNHAAAVYYSGEDSIMSDKDYDYCFDQLLIMEKITGILDENSPSQKVGYTVLSGLKKLEHKKPALSLDKTKDQDKLSEWLGVQEGVLSWKMDGLTAVAAYKEGKLISLVTRGDGFIGEDVTHNAPFIAGLPMEIPSMDELIVRGEVVISYEAFTKINEEIDDPDQRYKNPRNLASASLRLLNSRVAARRCMHFMAFEKVTAAEETSFEETLKNLEGKGFDVVDYILCCNKPETKICKTTAVHVKDAISLFNHKISSFEYPTDGLVLTYNDLKYRDSLGMTEKFPKHSLAFKWNDDDVETILRNIEWSASKTGLLNPVAVFDPVEIEGTSVSRASLHNLRYVENLLLGYGDTITVYKANKIIPQVNDNLTKNGNIIPVPDRCPICGEPTKRIKNSDHTSEFLYCMNVDCPAKNIGRFVRFVSRDGLNIKGLSGQTLSTLIELGVLKNLQDLFSLDKHKEKILNMEGFGEKSYENMILAVEESRHTTFKNFFYALGIPGAGHDAAKILERYLHKPYHEDFLKLVHEQNAEEVLTDMNGIGKTTADNILHWMKSHFREYSLLTGILDFTDARDLSEKEEEIKHSLAGKIFVITGTLQSYPNRKALVEEIESKGGKVAGSVSKNTNYLINNDTTSTSGKNKKAKELGIPIISEEQYKTLN